MQKYAASKCLKNPLFQNSYKISILLYNLPFYFLVAFISKNHKDDLCFDYVCVPKERRVVFSVILVSPYQNLEFNTYTQCNSRSSSQHHPPTLLNESVNWNGTPCIISITCSNSDVRARDSEVALAPYCNFVNTILALSRPKVY